ncbi:disease resistance protein RPP5-like [Oryza brachyantha]|uniref:disease resistance protein RPP5-like n=1 Tax=Oryza brachyantha TaxID=4533 RepID=UPI001AD9F330|nr:disease resistance protein RPP5-like [Oryza brachyantha]
MSGANRGALPPLEHVDIVKCGITGKWLCLMLQHAHALKELSLHRCNQITGLLIGEEENSQPSLMSSPEAPSLGYPGRDELLNDEQSNRRWLLPLSLGELDIGHVDSLKVLQPCFLMNLTGLKKLRVFDNPNLTSLQLHFCTALQELRIEDCELLNSLEGLESLGSLRLLRAQRCLGGHGENGSCILPQSLEELYISRYSQETLRPCFPRNLTCLKRLDASETSSLKYLALESCTALEELRVVCCESLAAIGGSEPHRSIRHLEVRRCPSLPACLPASLEGLERLEIDDPSFLTTLFCKHLTSLQSLELSWCKSEVERLTDEQDRALQLLTSLQELRFWFCDNLIDFPTGLHSLPSLKRLEIVFCKSIVKLPEKGLPPSLEELDITGCSVELAQQCRILVLESNLKVKFCSF